MMLINLIKVKNQYEDMSKNNISKMQLEKLWMWRGVMNIGEKKHTKLKFLKKWNTTVRYRLRREIMIYVVEEEKKYLV